MAQLDEREWQQIRESLLNEEGSDYAQVLDRLHELMQILANQRQRSSSQVSSAINRTLLRGTNATFSPSAPPPLARAMAQSVLMGASSAFTPPPRSQWPTVSGFELKGILGQGAFATVFLATNRQGNRVALKVGQLTN